MKPSSLITLGVVAVGAYLLYRKSTSGKQPPSTPAITPAAITPFDASIIDNAYGVGTSQQVQTILDNSANAAEALNKLRNNVSSPYAPNSPLFTTPTAYTPNPNTPVVFSDTIDPTKYKSYEDFFAAWFPTKFTADWQAKYSMSDYTLSPQERDRQAQIAADYRHSLYNTASDIWNTSRSLRQ